MPSRKKEIISEQIYHIYNRGIRKENIFCEDRDYERFLWKADYYKEKYNVQVIAWGLMPNHFHLLLRSPDSSRSPDSLISFMLKLQQSHAMYFKAKYVKDGPVFQGRFNAKPVEDEQYLVKLLHYVHNQPEHHKIATNWDWPYTSLSYYLSLSPDSMLINIDDYYNSFKNFDGLLDTGLEFEFM